MRGDAAGSRGPSLPQIALDVARSALPTIAALAIMLAADALLDDWAAVAVVLATLVALIVVVRKLDRHAAPATGADERSAGVRAAARAAPLIVASAVYVLTGLDVRALALSYVASWIVAQTMLAWWTHRG